MVTTVQGQFQIMMLDVQQSQLRASYYEQRIRTGAWRERIGKVYIGGLPEHGGTPMPEDQVLRDEVAIMYRHIELAEEKLEYAKGLLADL